jgi:dUTPase
MAQLPKNLSSQQRSDISGFLRHLEQQGQRWSALAPAAGEECPAALEAAVNTAIKDHRLRTGTRAALNHGFNLALLAPSGRVRLTPFLAEHQTVMAQLPKILDRSYRSKISRFLCYLEQQDQRWSALAPAAGDRRPAVLEAVVNTAIKDHGLDKHTRAALNQSFNLLLQGPSGQVRLAPVQPEHQTVMAQLPKSLTQQQRSYISRFLCHLEQQGQRWSALAPAAGEECPAALEAVVNTAIKDHGLHTGTRAALNHGFNLALVGSSGRVRLTPFLAEHQTVMAQLPSPLNPRYRSAISRFLCHLEQQGQRWSALAPAAGEVRPLALEAAINTAIKDHGLDERTRSAINRGFQLKLKGPSWR